MQPQPQPQPLSIHGLGACYRCGKPASTSVNLSANAAGGAGSNFVPACEKCHPSPFTQAATMERERCAQIAERLAIANLHGDEPTTASSVAQSIANLIRSGD